MSLTQSFRTIVRWNGWVLWNETTAAGGLRTTVWELKKYPVNPVEAERRILEAKYSPAPPVSRTRPQTPRLEGIPGRIQAILNRKGQVILYGPPGTGKTYWPEHTARDLAALNIFDDLFAALSVDQQQRITTHYVKLCSFHPSYGYEDFLEGYRPELVNGQMTFVRRDGIFKAAVTPPRRSLTATSTSSSTKSTGRHPAHLRRAADRAGERQAWKAILLPVSERAFEVAERLHHRHHEHPDRSIALLDTALRRRFGFVELMPDYGVLENAAVEGFRWHLAGSVEPAHRQHAGRDARNLQISHAYLLHDGKPVASFARFAGWSRKTSSRCWKSTATRTMTRWRAFWGVAWSMCKAKQ